MEHQQTRDQGQHFLLFSLFFAIFSFLTIQFIILPFILGGLSILFAILGRGSSERLTDKGIVSIVISSMSIILTIMVTVMAVYMLFTDPATRQQVNDYSVELYGQTFDEMIKERMW